MLIAPNIDHVSIKALLRLLPLLGKKSREVVASIRWLYTTRYYRLRSWITLRAKGSVDTVPFPPPLITGTIGQEWEPSFAHAWPGPCSATVALKMRIEFHVAKCPLHTVAELTVSGTACAHRLRASNVGSAPVQIAAAWMQGTGLPPRPAGARVKGKDASPVVSTPSIVALSVASNLPKVDSICATGEM